MKYWIDTEFLERGFGKPLELISVGIVSEDDRELYAINLDFKERHANDWVKENVIKHLPPRFVNPSDPSESPRIRAESMAWKKRQEIAYDLLAFIGDDDSPKFWSWCGGFDYVVISQLIGFKWWPEDWPHYFRDIQQIADELGTDIDDLFPNNIHHALSDAKRIRKLWNHLIEIQG